MKKMVIVLALIGMLACNALSRPGSAVPTSSAGGEPGGNQPGGNQAMPTATPGLGDVTSGLSVWNHEHGRLYFRVIAVRIGQAKQVVDDLLRGGARRRAFGRTNPLLFHAGFSSRLPLGKRRDYAVRWRGSKWGTAVTPFTPLRTAAKGGHEESVSYVAKNQRPGRISLLFTNRG